MAPPHENEALEEWEIVNLLSSLVDRSLIGVEESNGEIRYRLLETVRQYARDRLSESDEADLWRAKHLSYFLALAKASAHQLGDSDLDTLRRFDDEYDNFRIAMDWSRAMPGCEERALALAAHLVDFWKVRGYFSEGRAYVENVLGSCRLEAAFESQSSTGGPGPADQYSVSLARALNTAGVLAEKQADFNAARHFLEESVALSRKLGDRAGVARALNNLAIVTGMQGNDDLARSHYEEIIGIHRSLNNLRGVITCLNNLAVIAIERGEFADAQRMLEESLQIARGDPQFGEGRAALTLINLGPALLGQGDLPAARAYLEESLAIFKVRGQRRGIAHTLHRLGRVSQAETDFPAAKNLYSEALTTFKELGSPVDIAIGLESLASLAFALSEPKQAAMLWAAADNLRTQSAAPLRPHARSLQDQQIASARAAWSEPGTFDQAWKGGYALTTDAAVALALAFE